MHFPSRFRRRADAALALAVALIPALAAHAAWWMSMQAGDIPACIPYWDGCTSISRAARHGDANLLFRSTMLPVAAMLVVLWWRARVWLRVRDADPGQAMVLLGMIATVCLALYVAYLGSPEQGTRGLRRLGAIGYFAATYLAQLWFVRRLRDRGARDAASRGMLCICVLLLLLGLLSTAASTFVPDPALKDRVENVIEWSLGLLFTLWFLLLAMLFARPDDAQLLPAKKRAPPPPRKG